MSAPNVIENRNAWLRNLFSVSVLVCIGNFIISVTASCLYYSELHHLNAYHFFSTQLNTFLTWAVAGVGLLLCRHRGTSSRDIAGGSEPVGLCFWIKLSCLLSLQDTLEVMSIQNINNDALIAIMQQAVVPLTLVLSFMLLGTRYTLRSLGGAALVVVGCALGFIPILSLENNARSYSVWWMLVFVASRVPQAMANVLAERAFTARQDLSWVLRFSFFVKLFGMPCNVLSALLISVMKGDSIRTVLNDYAGGLCCLLSVFRTGCGGSTASDWKNIDHDLCVTSAVSVLLFAVPGALFLITNFQVVQYTSATTYFLLVALQLPVQSALLSMPAVMGSLHSTFHMSYVYCIIIIGIGIVCYGADEHLRVPNDVDSCRSSGDCQRESFTASG
eukprot:TRINITY_DN43211_c0_g1_i1.p1 TRINITY_DN43211_c0_g1~~TRINITY_DN43211_c0_g1_i1.p1  ORF type:complete len:389 (-),score=42.85 TRINITY_DN43211_c0_g1_i1:27-1193(-)